jgi:hypothetical protein
VQNRPFFFFADQGSSEHEKDEESAFEQQMTREIRG